MVDQKFLSNITNINKRTEQLNNYSKSYNNYSNTKLRDVLTPEKENEINEKMEALGGLFQNKTEELKQNLAEIEDDNNKIKEVLGEDSFEYETRNLQWQKATQDLANQINVFRGIQLKHKKEESERLKNQYLIVNPKATPQEVDQLINSDTSAQLLQKVIAGGSASSKKQFEEIENRNKKIRDISKRIDELLKLIAELHDMVNRSGSMFDKIEVRIAKTKVTSEATNVDLEKARKYQIARMWIKRIIFLIIAIAAIVFVIWLAAKVSGNFGNSGSSNNSGGSNQGK